MLHVVHIGHMAKTPRWDAESDGHPYHEIIVLIGGKLDVQVAKEHFIASAGDILLYRAGTPHVERSDPKNLCETLFFCFSAEDELLDRVPTRTRDDDGRIRSLAAWGYELRFAHTRAEIVAAEALVACMLSQSRYLVSGAAHPLVMKVRRYIGDHITDKILLDDLARLSSFSKFHFSRIYRRLSGRTPMDDVTSIRIETARNLIIGTTLTMAQVAERSGFGDPYHLAHVFQRKLHMTPTALRSRNDRHTEVLDDGTPGQTAQV